jgi:hypothetical protein
VVPPTNYTRVDREVSFRIVIFVQQVGSMNKDLAMKPAPAWIRGGVAVLMAIWATGQMWVVHSRGLNSWRGGGFGMYAGFHPVQNDAWVWEQDQPVPQRYWKQSDDDSELYRIVRPHLTFPRPHELQSDLRKRFADGKGGCRVAVTALRFDLDSLELSRTFLLDVSVGAEP